MAVTTTTTRHSFNGSGSAYSSGGTPVGQGPFSINFTVIDATHIDVYWTKASSGAGTPTSLSVSGNLTINTHYTIQNAGTGSTATITWVESGFTADSTVTFPTSSDLIVITRNVPLTQVTNYQNNATIDAETIEASFDKLAQTAQQLSDDKDYSFKFASNLSGATGFNSTADTAGTVTGDKASRANKYLSFDANGDLVAGSEITGTPFTSESPSIGDMMLYDGGKYTNSKTLSRISQILDSNGNEAIKFGTTSSAVNEITVTNAATGNPPTISATGEVDKGIDFENSEGEELLKLASVSSAVNEITCTNSATNNGPTLSATGGDANVDINLSPKGTGELNVDGKVKSINGQSMAQTPFMSNLILGF